MTGLRVGRRDLIGGLGAMAALATAGSGLAIHRPTRRALLDAVSRWNDRVQGALFSPERLAPSYPESEISRPFRCNGFYPEAYAPRIEAADWALELGGRIRRRTPVTLAELRGLPQEAQVTRLICIEGWSMVGKWSGVPLRALLEALGADLSARHVTFDCADGYRTSLDMASALHPQTILALDFLDRPLPRAFGFTARLRSPVKLGFKNAKFLTRMAVTNEAVGGYWEDQGYNWHAGL